MPAPPQPGCHPSLPSGCHLLYPWVLGRWPTLSTDVVPEHWLVQVGAALQEEGGQMVRPGPEWHCGESFPSLLGWLLALCVLQGSGGGGCEDVARDVFPGGAHSVVRYLLGISTHCMCVLCLASEVSRLTQPQPTLSTILLSSFVTWVSCGRNY